MRQRGWSGPTRHIVRCAHESERSLVSLRFLHPSPAMGRVARSAGWGRQRIDCAARSTTGSPPPVTSFAALTMCHPPHEVGGIRKSELRSRTARSGGISKSEFRSRTSAVSLSLPFLYGEGGWPKASRVGSAASALANSSHSRSSPPPVTSFAALTMCHPPHKRGRDKTERASLVSTPRSGRDE
jgi:hypothetical protein